ncbi:DUF2332 domain-containing protein [Actibacterium sp. 188UL27-1]|uniref:DUF2332 domain-containing protein n=1 Tax=Actibacterium sp. 188UL27-1 TaxID=2786961 RepID=UPI00195C6493|nr:DUF2332 family protein [Actibacterium sp. 188UL27-1]MBM7066183.1 DUF2332 family protein [Actibacterium sp. 188UL27-1]
MTDILKDFADQSIGCTKLGSSFMGRLMALFAERLTPGTSVADRILTWPGNTSAGGASVPLRIGGGLHALVLNKADADLKAVFPPHDATDDALWAAVETALTRHKAWFMAWLDHAPQTNEVRRSTALIPAFHMVARATGLPLALHELGTSGGLNLRADQFHLIAGNAHFGPADSPIKLAPDWTGPAPSPADLRITTRRGVDLNPLDPTNPDDQLRLRAYLWADQLDRMERTEAAMQIAAAHPAHINRGDAIEWLANVLSRPQEGETRVIYHTIAWQYFPEALQARGADLLAKAGERATSGQPLAHISMEWDSGRGAALTAQIWPGGGPCELARVDFHGRWLDWTGPTEL